ncbi:hypothetical protein PHYBOEH_000693 [Phytophthora boehmeriae]|uniref:EF-hand domain-containing protein n=1 Tax=Phytophthora boehmeriae TaxID=109152 RepID=A0A8T1X0A6_9STRA|nr:hypothetical protein PHYBOEH_000693 [Phytophthora boehmeriae]
MNLQDLRKAALDSNLTLPGGLTDADLRLLFQYLDSDNDGRVAPDELIAIVRPPLAGRRLEYVREAFAKLAKATGSHDLEKALLEPSDVVEEFDASAHPDVVAGRRGADHVCREFLETFDIDGGAQGGKVTWEQWRSYYHNVSASIASDKAFEDMVCSVWHLNLSNNRNSHTEDLERQPQQQPQQTHQRVRGKTMMSNVDIAHQASTTPSATEAPVSFIKERKILSLKDIASGTGIAEASRAVSSRNQFLGTDAGTTYAGDMILHAIKHRIRQSSSLADVVQLRLQLSQASDARTGSITASRCCESLNAALGLALSEAHGRALFEHLSQANADASSGSSGARFLQDQQRANGHDSGSSRLLLRLVLGCFLDRLSPACLASATHVFSALQSAGNGRVFPAALASSFQASRHPAVVLGRMTTAEAFQDFARNFEVASGGSTDGSVAFQHFEAFCVNLRATLGTDELLQMVLRDCFRVA